MLKLSEEKLKEIEKEVDKFDLNKNVVESALNHRSSADIHDFVAKVANGLSQATAAFILIKIGGTAGLVLSALIVISALAGALKAYSLIRSERELKKEYSRFMQHLKDEGIYDEREND
jgi:hypothetical protein